MPISTHCMPFGYLCLHLVYMMLNIEPKFEEFYGIMVDFYVLDFRSRISLK